MFWVIPLIISGAVVSYYWDDIAAWFQDVVLTWLDEMGVPTEALRRGFVEIDRLMTRGRRFVKRIVAHIQNSNGKIVKRVYEEEICADEVPDEVRNELSKGETVRTKITLN